MRGSAGWRGCGGGMRDMTEFGGVTGESEEEDAEELSQDIVENEGLEVESDWVGLHTGTLALQVPVSIRVR